MCASSGGSKALLITVIMPTLRVGMIKLLVILAAGRRSWLACDLPGTGSKSG